MNDACEDGVITLIVIIARINSCSVTFRDAGSHLYVARETLWAVLIVGTFYKACRMNLYARLIVLAIAFLLTRGRWLLARLVFVGAIEVPVRKLTALRPIKRTVILVVACWVAITDVLLAAAVVSRAIINPVACLGDIAGTCWS